MLRGLPHLAKYMPEAKDARRLIPDPESELEFESISKVFPLPDAQAAALELALAGGSGLQQQLQAATNNNWASIGAVGVAGMHPTQTTSLVYMSQQPEASALQAPHARDAIRVNDTFAASFRLEAELGAQERQNSALMIEVAARRQLAEFDDREQQANSRNAALALLVGSIWNPPTHFGYK
jgi:hypothetical protein